MQSEIEVKRLSALEKKRRSSSSFPALNPSAATPTSSYGNNTSTPYNFSTHATDPFAPTPTPRYNNNTSTPYHFSTHQTSYPSS
mmetsp:Transcript_18023/g.32670  ORF Transcript_18023/g.32670 Transcript_18023/m.32670 type:complete len:84 (-) Transcript_18023:1815-2066(-)